MGILIGLEHVSHEWPGKRVLADQTLGINEGERIGIVGRNGDGKSTLLDIVAKRTEPDGGSVTWRGGIHVGYLGQTDSLDDGETVGHAVVGETPDYVWAADPRIRGIVDELIGDLDWNAPVGELSGGQRRRCDLARLLVGTWDVICMDEPTNHLDMQAIEWLAEHLKARWPKGQGALLMVTHDRWFLDEVCEHMWEVHDCEVTPFEGGYSAYIQQRVERDRQAQVAEQRRQNQLRRELAWLARGAQARSTKPKFRIDAARELIADVPPLRNTLELKRMAVARLGKQVVDLTDVTVRLGGKTVLDDVSWIIGPGDRFGIVGENGAGKTTLLRVIEGALAPSAGRVKIGKTVKFAVLSQHLDNLVKLGSDRVREVIGRYSRRVMLDGKEATPAQLLERLGFTRDDLNEPVCDLSGGQKRRLALMLILLDEPNVLILDEPGNDLDTDMLAQVEDLLDGWPGTLLLVTHDRYLMERVTDNQYALINGKIRHLPRGVDEYLELVGRTTDERGGVVASSSGKASASKQPSTSAGEQATGVASKLSGGEIRALRKSMASAERKMDTLRGKIEGIHQAMTEVDPSDYVKLGDMQKEIKEIEAQIEALEEEWMEAAEALGE